MTSSPLADFDPGAAARGPSGDLIAGVVQRFEGPISGSALLALEPGDALLWLQRGDDDADPLARFVEWGSRLLEGVTRALGDALGGEVVCGPGSLEERSLMAALLGTHAPSDTLVLSLHGEMAFPVARLPEIRAPFGLHVLLAPKRVAAVLDGLRGDEGPPSA